MTAADVLIIGGGAAGLSTAWHLAQANSGLRITVLERREHLAAESSALNAAILRTVDADPMTTKIAAQSARFLHDPPSGFSDVPLVESRGLLLFPGKGAKASQAEESRAAAASVRCERIDSQGVAALHPWIAPLGEGALFFPDDGRIDIAALMAGFARGARAAGVVTRRHATVASLDTAGDRVRGVTLKSGERISAGTTVIAAGGWAGVLGRSIGSDPGLRPTRRHLMVTRPDGQVRAEWPVIWQLGDDPFYARPESGGMLLCACDLSDVDPEHCTVVDDVRDLIARKAARYLPPVLSAGAGHFWCGMRTLTRDGRFVVGPDAAWTGLFWVAGLAGAGMVCAAEVGRIAAGGILGEAGDPDIAAALSPSRASLRA